MEGIIILGNKVINLGLVTLVNEEEKEATLVSLLGGELLIMTDIAERKAFSDYLRLVSQVDLTEKVELYRHQAKFINKL